jgi:hypothetical protein
MKLSQYNEYLWAVVGTIALLLLGPELFQKAQWLVSSSDRPNLEIVPGADQPATLGGPDGKAASQRLLFCDVVDVPGSTTRFVPVAVANATDADEDVSVYGLAALRVNYDSEPGWRMTGCEGPRFNVIVWDVEAGAQRLLLDEPRPVTNLVVPDEKCSDGQGRAPCDRLLWAIHFADTNSDGRIGFDDAEALFVSDLAATALTQVSPPGANVIDHGWQVKTDKLWLRVRPDRNGDDKYDPRDGSDLLETSFRNPGVAQPIVDEVIRKRLEAWIRKPGDS